MSEVIAVHFGEGHSDDTHLESSRLTQNIRRAANQFIRRSLVISALSVFSLPSFAAVQPKSDGRTEAIQQSQPQQVSQEGKSKGASSVLTLATSEGEQVRAAEAERHQQWLEGVNEAAARNGCKPNVIVQREDESTADVIRLFSMTAMEGTCLALAPISVGPGPIWYTFASGGVIDGVTIYYLSDVSRIRIWNGAPVSDN